VFQRLKATLESVVGGGKLRRALVVALLLAFVLQTQLAASHFHLIGSGNAATIADAGKAAPDKQQKKLPVEDDCPICQQLAGAHNVLIYVAVALALPNLSAAPAVAPPDERTPVPLITRNWQSRAPPL
jgi:DUF2946 family protein